MKVPVAKVLVIYRILLMTRLPVLTIVQVRKPKFVTTVAPKYVMAENGASVIFIVLAEV